MLIRFSVFSKGVNLVSMNPPFAPVIKAHVASGSSAGRMRCGWDEKMRRRPEVAGRPVDVRTHIGVRFAVIPLSGVAEALLKTAPV